MSGWSSSVPAAFCAAAGTLSRENLPSRNRNEMLPRSMGAWPSDDLSRSATDVPTIGLHERDQHPQGLWHNLYGNL